MTTDVLTLDELAEIEIACGNHDERGTHLCTLEIVAWLAGEPHGDKPQCACPVVSAFIRVWQDTLPDDLRNELCRPLIPRLLDSRASDDITDRRAVLVADWCQRVVLPMWCDLVPTMTETAAALRALARASTVAQLTEVDRVNVVTEARAKCAAAEDAAWDAAGDAAGDAAWDAAGDAAWAAAWDAAGAAAWAAAGAAASAAARAAAWAAARDAAWDAAWAAARDAIADTKVAIWRTVPAMIGRLLEEGAQ